jgi:hypothetical protein
MGRTYSTLLERGKEHLKCSHRQRFFLKNNYEFKIWDNKRANAAGMLRLRSFPNWFSAASVL